MTARLEAPKDVGSRGVMNPERAAKVAAKRIGVSVHEYLARRAAGEKWCPGCQAWLEAVKFGTDRVRSDGLSGKCGECQRAYNRAYFYRAACEKCGGPRHAQGGRFCRSCYQERSVESRWIKWALRGQRKIMARRDRARRLVQREERELEYGLFAHGAVLDLDAFLFEDSQDSFSDRLLISDDDPQAHLEAQELRGLIGGIEIDDVERMNDETVDWLRHKLASAGYMPGRITAEERERVAVKRKEYVPRRAESQGSRRMKDLLPEDVLPEARGHSKLMKIARQNQRSRKRRRMLAPPKAEA